MIAHQKLIVCCVPKSHFVNAKFKADGSAGMVSIMCVDFDVANVEGHSFLDIFEDEVGLDVIEAHGKIGVGEHLCEELACRFFKADRRPDVHLAMGIVDRGKEGESGEMVPMRVRN